jgi:hypothetical protein
MKTEIIPVVEEMSGPPWSAQPWLGSAALSVLAELNEQCLGLLVEEAATQSSGLAHPLLRDLAQLWAKLDGKALKRAAACPYLLMDAGFADPQRWMWMHGHQVLERERGPTVPFFTVAHAATVMRTLLTYGWHLAQNRQSAARLLLGMSPQCVDLVRACSLSEVGELAGRHPAWMQPRWPYHVRIWREFLTAAIAGEGQPLQRARLRGLQILAADARSVGGGWRS